MPLSSARRDCAASSIDPAGVVTGRGLGSDRSEERRGVHGASSSFLRQTLLLRVSTRFAPSWPEAATRNRRRACWLQRRSRLLAAWTRTPLLLALLLSSMIWTLQRSPSERELNLMINSLEASLRRCPSRPSLLQQQRRWDWLSLAQWLHSRLTQLAPAQHRQHDSPRLRL